MTSAIFDGAGQAALSSTVGAPLGVTTGFRDGLAVSSQAFSGVRMSVSPNNCWGLALHGVCPPSTAAFFTEVDNASILANWLNYIDNVSFFYGGALMSAISDPFLFALPPGVMLAYPGQVIRFPKPLERGVAVVPVVLGGVPVTGATPWAYPGRSSFANPRVAGYPLLRFYTEDPGDNEQIGYVKGAVQENGKTPLPASPPTDMTDAAYIPPSARQLLIHFTDDNPTQRIQGTESATFEVWFRGPTGLWMHNPADDFTPTGRGAASASHDVEIYTIPPAGADAFVVVFLSGNSFNFEYALTE